MIKMDIIKVSTILIIPNLIVNILELINILLKFEIYYKIIYMEMKMHFH